MQETDEEEVDVLDEMMPDLYVEKATNLLYEVKFFDKFIFVRPATPLFYLAIRKISPLEFSREFDLYLGDPEEARSSIRGSDPDIIIIE